MVIRPAQESDFVALVPLLKGFATTREVGLLERFTKVRFYTRLGLQGEPNSQPEYPFYEIDFLVKD